MSSAPIRSAEIRVQLPMSEGVITDPDPGLNGVQILAPWLELVVELEDIDAANVGEGGIPWVINFARVKGFRVEHRDLR